MASVPNQNLEKFGYLLIFSGNSDLESPQKTQFHKSKDLLTSIMQINYYIHAHLHTYTQLAQDSIVQIGKPNGLIQLNGSDQIRFPLSKRDSQQRLRDST